MRNRLLPIGALLALSGVALGAFGAHALKAQLDAYSLGIYQTAVLYQLLHALGVMVIAVAAPLMGNRRQALISGYLLVAGVLIFSGSLYLLAISGQRWLGAITPVGGVLLLAGWGLFARASWKGGSAS